MAPKPFFDKGFRGFAMSRLGPFFLGKLFDFPYPL
jgi:hypothetical protein